MQDRTPYDDPGWNLSDDQGGDPVRPSLIKAGLIVAIAVFAASLGPRELFPALLSSFLQMSAWLLALMAVLRQERLFSERLTDWDVAAFCWAISLAAGWFVDLEALQALVEAAPAGDPAI